MRDYQAMHWVAKAVFGLSGLPALADGGMLSPGDRRQLETALDMLIRVRNRLHYLSRRKNDQLIFEFQEELAAIFGFTDQEGQRAVERFMRAVYGHLQTVTVITDLFFEHVAEVLDPVPGTWQERELEKNIVVRGGTVRFARSDLLAEKPRLMMRLFLHAAREKLPVHHRSRQVITASLHLVTERLRRSRRMAGIFLELLMQPEPPREVLETILETGLLSAYLPELAPVESLAQHDLYHIYTVDRHQVQTVAELGRLRQEEADLFRELTAPHLLYLAALCHDIGKGRRQDHSRLGAELIRIMGARLGLCEQECDCLAFLVQYHLYLPENALRRDLEDQQFIGQAAEMIGDPQRLVMLYLLSIADSRATGPSAWSQWKAALLAEFFFRLRACLAAGSCRNAGMSEDMDSDHGVAWLRDQVKGLLQGPDQPMISVDALPADYLLGFTPEMVVHHLRLHREKMALLASRLLLFAEVRHGFWSLLVMTRDRAGLLARIFGVLALHNFKVLAAQIFTWPDGTVVDVFDLAPLDGIVFAEQDWARLEEEINLALEQRFDIDGLLHSRIAGNGFPRRRAVQQLDRKVLVDDGASSRYTVIEVHGGDHPDILYRLTRKLAAFGLDVHRARIATEVEQLIVVFFVTLDGEKINDKTVQNRIYRSLLAMVSGQPV